MNNNFDTRTWMRVTIIVAILGCMGAMAAALIGILPDILTLTPIPPSSSPVHMNLAIPADEGWVSTGLILSVGQSISIRADGKVDYNGQDPDAGESNPDGDGSPCNKASIEKLINQELDIDCMVSGVSWGMLVGKVGSGAPFAIGSNYQLIAKTSGELFLGVNDCCSLADNAGEFMVTIFSP